MQFGLAVGFCAIFALIAADSPRIALGSVFAAYIFLPFTPIGRIFVGNTGVGIHVATLLVSTLWVAKLVAHRSESRLERDGASIPTAVHYFVATFVVGALVNQVASGAAPATAMAFILNQIIAPYLYFILCVDENRRDPTLMPLAAKSFVIVGMFQSVIAIGVVGGLWGQPYANAFSGSWWWHQQFVESGRQLGTLDSPLNLGLFLAACVPLASVFRSFAANAFCQFILIAGILLTQSRIAIIAGLAGVLYLMFFGIRQPGRRLAMIATVIVGYVAFNSFGLVSTLLERVANDKGSSDARTLAWGYLAAHWNEFLVTGVGIFDSKSYLISRGFYSSAESAIFSYAVAFGLAFTLCYFAAIAWIIVHAVRMEGRISGPAMSAILVAISIQFYSSVATESSAAFILWTTLFLALGSIVSDPRNSSIDIITSIPSRPQHTKL